MKQLSVFLGGMTLCAAIVSPAFAGPSDLYGEPAPVTAAGRTVVIDHDTQTVNVTGGDTIQFIVHGQHYAWNFDSADNIKVVNLNALLPAGTLHHTVRVYIARDPDYSGA